MRYFSSEEEEMSKRKCVHIVTAVSGCAFIRDVLRDNQQLLSKQIKK